MGSSVLRRSMNLLRRLRPGPMAVPAPAPSVEPPGAARCHWPFSSLVVLSDLTAVCECTDEYKNRVVGNLAFDSVQDVWRGPVMTPLRRALEHGYASFCQGCPRRDGPTHKESEAPLLVVEDGPQILQIELSALCNISCPLRACTMNNTGQMRRNNTMGYEDFCRIIDGIGPNLEIIRYHIFGETFMNPDAYRMIAYARQKKPDVFMEVSTNGLLFTDDELRRDLVESGLNYVLFSIDGAVPANYARYRRGGDLNRVLENLAGAVRLRNELKRDVYLCWRYILFNWNDTDAEMAEALRMAQEMGVDQLVWHLNEAQDKFSSERFRPGTDDFERIRHAVWGYSGTRLANALRGPVPPYLSASAAAAAGDGVGRADAARGGRRRSAVAAGARDEPGPGGLACRRPRGQGHGARRLPPFRRRRRLARRHRGGPRRALRTGHRGRGERGSQRAPDGSGPARTVSGPGGTGARRDSVVQLLREPAGSRSAGRELSPRPRRRASTEAGRRSKRRVT